jgi:hypothetical protein
MSVSTDLVVLLVLSVLTLIIAVRCWQTTKAATPNHIRTASTEKPEDDDPNNGRRFGGEQPTISGEHD